MNSTVVSPAGSVRQPAYGAKSAPCLAVPLTAAAQISTGCDSGRETVAVKVSGVVPLSPSTTVASATLSDARERNRATCGSWSLVRATRPRRRPPASRR